MNPRTLIFLAALFSFALPVSSQVATCDPSVPYNVVNLVGQPAGIWYSPVHSRDGHCCTASGSDRCTSFEILVDTGAAMINFEIVSGAIPSGSMYYQISCGPPVAVGHPICLVGPGPHYLTFCKPGNNTNVYRVTSIPKPTFPKDDTARIGCSLPISVLGMVESSVSFTSVFPGAPGAYNSYLNCGNGCDTVIYTPAASAPPFVDYRICGTPIATTCGYVAVCDTVRIYNVSALTASYTPNPARFCTDGPGVLLAGSASGGLAPYSFSWYNQSLVHVGTGSTYTATTGETFQLEVRDLLYDSLYCPATYLSVPVTATNPPTVNAGPDQTLCPANPVVVLNGSVQNATGGTWSGGAGTFSPNANSLLASYTPTPAEIAAGQVTLTLTSTGAGGGCTNSSDAITIHFPTPLSVNVADVNVACNGNSGTLNSIVSGGTTPYVYQWSNGASTNSITATAGIYCLTIVDALGCISTDCGTITEPSAMNITVSSTPCSTNGGSDGTANVSATGGTSPYTYAWSNGGTTAGISGLSYGVYNAVVTDNNGCQIASGVVVNEPRCNGFQVSSSRTNVGCFGAFTGTATATVVSGTSPYTYQWNDPALQTTPTATNLDAGVYQCLVSDANSCVAVVNVTVTQPAQLANTMTHTDVTTIGGNNGSATATVSGGVPAYTYAWSNGGTTSAINSLVAGTYTLSIHDQNNCALADSVRIQQPPCNNLTISVVTTPVSCNGGSNGAASSVVLLATNPVSYLWSTGSTASSISGLSAGNYSLTVTDGLNCSDFVNFTITQPSPLSVALSPTNISCNAAMDGTIETTVSGGTYPYSYAWSNGLSVEDLIHLTNGSYSVTVTDAHGCSTNANTAIARPAAIAPTAVSTQITCNGGTNGAIDLSVSGGISPYTYSWSTGSTAQDLSSLSAGTYIVTVKDANNCTTPLTVNLNEPSVVQVDTITKVCPVPGSGLSAVTVSASGGNSGAYQISFNNGTSYLASGIYNTLLPVDSTYIVMVRDTFGCVLPQADTLVVDPAVDIQAVSFNSCVPDGATTVPITLTVTGGNGGLLSASFDNGATFLPAGIYTHQVATGATYQIVVRDSSGCASVTETANVLNEIVLSGVTSSFAGGYQVSCAGSTNGSVDLSAAGGSGAYTYNWSSGATTQDISGVAAGTYSVIVTDGNACSDTIAFVLSQPGALGSTLVSVNNFNGYGISCNGATNGSLDLGVSGGVTSYTYSWSNGATTQDISSLAAGTYSVSITDANGCVTTNSITLTQPAALSNSISNVDVLCNGGTNGSVDLTMNGGVLPYSYSWNTGATTQDLASVVAGSYSVSITDANGCTSTASATVTEPTTLTSSGTTTNLTCFQSGNGTIDLSVSGGTTPYSYSWNNAATSQDLSSLAAGNYSVTITDAHGCINTRSFTITEPALLTASAVATTDFNGYEISCAGNSNGAVNLTVAGGTTGYSYSWSNSATTEDLSNLPAGTYSVSVTDAQGCVATSTVTLSEPAALTNSFTQTNVLCNGNTTGAIDLSMNGGVLPYSYSWSTGATTQDISALGAGTYSVSITDANGCASTASTTITEPTILASSGTTTNLTCYQSGNGAIDLSVSGGATPYSYSWSNAAITQDLSSLAAGLYSVTITDANGCTSSASFTVTEPSLLLANAVATTDFNGYEISCAGNSDGNIDLTVVGGTSGYNYSWSNGAITEDLTGLAAGTYSVSVTDAQGCVATASISLTAPAALATSTVQTNVMCNGNTTGAIDLTVNGGVTPYSYGWSNGANTQDISSLIAGSYSVTITDANGCSSSASATITEPSALSLSGNVTSLQCYQSNDGAIDLTVTGGITPYNFSWSNSANTEDIANLPAGNYSVNITDAVGCANSISFTITQPSQINASITAVSNFNNYEISCYGSSDGWIDMTISGGVPAYSYQWSNGAITEDISSVPAGTYSLAITDANGCTKNTVVVLTQPMALDVNASHVDVPCNGFFTGSIDLSMNGGITPYVYAWSNGATTQDLSSIGAGTYSVHVTDANGCAIDTSVEITQTAPVTTSYVPTLPLCNGDNNGSIDLSAAGGTTPYSYNWSNGATSQDANNLGAGTYYVTVTDSNGCEAQDTIILPEPSSLTISVTSPLQPNGFNVSTYGGTNGSVNLEVSGGTTPYQYAWSNGGTTQDLNGIAAGTYSVTVTDANGCTIASSIALDQPLVLEMPTGYSPNSDGANDYFVVHGIEAYPHNRIEVFNRWGNLVYAADDYRNTWNGYNDKGDVLPDGTYFVVLTINNENITLKGYVDLRR